MRPRGRSFGVEPDAQRIRREVSRLDPKPLAARADVSPNVSARSGDSVYVQDAAVVTLPPATATGELVGVAVESGAAIVRASGDDIIAGGGKSALVRSLASTLFMATSRGVWSPIGRPISDSITDYGAIGNGSEDDTVAIQRAITALATLGGSLRVPQGTFTISAAVSATLAANIKHRIHGDGLIRATSTIPLDTALFSLTMNGKDLAVHGVTVDGNDRCNRLLYCDQASDSTNEVTIDGLTLRNCYADAVTNAIALYVRGGYEHVRLINSSVTGVNRAATINNGVCIGASITTATSAGSYYPKRTTVSGCHFKDITNSEAYDNAQNKDTDGLSILGSLVDPATRYYQDAHASVSDCSFENCKGRSIKIQHDAVTVANCNFKRSVVGLGDGGGFCEIDFQATRGTVANCNFHYLTSGVAEETLDSGGSVISVRNSFTTRNRAYSITNCHAYSTVTRGKLNTFIEASHGGTPTGGGSLNNFSLHISNSTCEVASKAYVNVTPYAAASWPARGRVSIAGGSARGLLHGVVSCSSGSTKRMLTSVAISDFNNYQPGPIDLLITSATAANPVVVTTSADHGLSNGDVVTIGGCNQWQLNGNSFTVANKTATTFELSGENGIGRTVGSDGIVTGKGIITGATQASPVVITTAAAHGLVDGDTAFIRNVAGMTEINERGFVVTRVSATTFSLNEEDGTGHTAYTSGGVLSPTIKATFVTGATATEAPIECRMSNCYGVESYASGQANAGGHGFAIKGDPVTGSSEPGTTGAKCFSCTLYDDQEAEIPQPVYGNAILLLVVSSYGATALGAYVCSISGGADIWPGITAPADISTDGAAPGANPDVDTDLNIWVKASGKIGIKNRLGSTRTFTFFMVGV